MNTSQIPDSTAKSVNGMSNWFDTMATRGLLFHPENEPSDVVSTTTGERLFNADECAKLDGNMAEMFGRFGDRVCETAYPIFMRTAGFPTGD